MTWQLFVVINLLTQSLLVPLQRLLLRKKDSDPISFIVASQVITGLLLVPIVLIHGLVLPNLPKYGWLILVMFILYSIGHVLYSKTLKAVEASVFQTLLNTSTVWVVLMGYLVLKEHLRITDLIGTALILASVGLLIERKKPFHLEKSMLSGLGVGLIFGIALSLWVYIGRHSDLLSWTMLSFFGVPLLITLVRPKTLKHTAYYFSSNVLLRLLLLGIVWAVDNLTSLGAYKAGTVSIVAPILQSSVILSVLVAIIFLHERQHLKRKITAAIVCFVGVLLLAGA